VGGKVAFDEADEPRVGGEGISGVQGKRRGDGHERAAGGSRGADKKDRQAQNDGVARNRIGWETASCDARSASVVDGR